MFKELMDRYEAWVQARTDLSSREEAGPPMTPSYREWEESDEEAVQLLHEFAALHQDKK